MSRPSPKGPAVAYALSGLGLLAASAWWERLGGWGADEECRRDTTLCPDVGPGLPATGMLWAITYFGTALVAFMAWRLQPSQLAVRIGWAALLGVSVCVANWHQPIWAVIVGAAMLALVVVRRERV